jgi:hypothetical protein
MDLDNLQTFHSLFSNWRFHIPDYQRGYAWGQDQWQDLMDDLSTLTEDNDHFTGLLVLHENKDPNLRARARGIVKDVHDIVDGQQRLTTILILLNAIRNEMLAIGTDDLKEICDGIQQTYLHEPGPGNMLVYKLLLDRNNHNFFIRNILGAEDQDIIGPQMQSHHNLLGARDFFQDELRKKNKELGETYPVWLETIYSKIANQMKVMVYHLRSEADAGVVFETMNSRGKKPNQLDLVKNYLLFLASKLEEETRRKLSSDINDAWTTIFEQLSSAGRPEDEDTLLEMHWVTTYDYDRKRWAAKREKSDHIKNRFKPMIVKPELHQEMATDIENYVQTLKCAVVAYRDILQPEHSEAFQIFTSQPEAKKQVVRFSEKLVRIGILRPFIPLLIALRLKYPEDAQTYLKYVQLCEKYAFRAFRVANRRLTGAESVLFRLANQLYTGKLSIETTQDELRRNLLKSCSDELFIHSFDIHELNPWYGRTGLKYFLFEYEEHLFGGGDPIFKWDAVIGGKEKTIEHILPQNPDPEGDWPKFFGEEEHKKYCQLLGNLTLTEDNSRLGNKSFHDKKGCIGQPGCYANSILKIERELAVIDNWTPTEVEKRQQRLGTWALERWSVEAPPPLPPEGWDRQLQVARQNGVEAQFLALDETAVKLGLGKSPGKKCMRYKPTYNWIKSAITVYCYQDALQIFLRPHNFPKRPGLTVERINQAFSNTHTWWVPASQFPGFISRLEGLLAEAGPEVSVVIYTPISTPSESAAEKRLQDKADLLGCGSEFCILVDAMRNYPMHPRMQINWAGVKFTPLKNKEQQLIWLGPDLYFSPEYKNFQKYFGIPAKRVEEILGIPEKAYLKKDQVPDMLIKLERLFAEIKDQYR